VSQPIVKKLFGGTGDDEAYGIQQTNDGGYIVAGYSTSSSNGDISTANHGGMDCWIVKLDATGNIGWNKLIGGNMDDWANCIRQTTDGGYILAGYSYSSANGNVTGTNHGGIDAWIVKLDASGNIIWNKLLGGLNNDVLGNINQTSDGGYIVAGYSLSSANGDVTGVNHGVGTADYWILKLDASGNIVWNKLIGGNGDDVAQEVWQTNDGGYIVVGNSNSSASGNVTGTTHGSADSWIVKLDATGNIIWNRLYGANGSDNLIAIRQTIDGGYIAGGWSYSSANGDVTGVNHGQSDYWIVKLDATGNIIWNKLYGGTQLDRLNSMEQTLDGGYILAGSTYSPADGDVPATSHGGYESWILKLDAMGSISWNKLYGGSDQDFPNSIQQTSDGGYIVAGSSSSSYNGDVTSVNHGISDFWIIKLDRNGILY
jgi:hypothetical protein